MIGFNLKINDYFSDNKAPHQNLYYPMRGYCLNVFD